MNVNKTEVLKQIMEHSLDWHSKGVVNIGWIAKRMNRTPYYVKKRIKTLIEEGYLITEVRSGGWCEFSLEPYPPVKGYKLTEKAKSTELYSIAKKQEEDAFIRAFG